MTSISGAILTTDSEIMQQTATIPLSCTTHSLQTRNHLLPDSTLIARMPFEESAPGAIDSTEAGIITN
jgi:hypothetical protein